MQARRTFSHGSQGGWSAIAVHLQPAEGNKEGFYLSLFPDARPPAVVFLRASQLLSLVNLATSPHGTDQTVWDVVSRIPMEPLLPSRSLSIRLRALLVDFASPLREEARAQVVRMNERTPAPMPEDAPSPATAMPATAMPTANASSPPIPSLSTATPISDPDSNPTPSQDPTADPTANEDAIPPHLR